MSLAQDAYLNRQLNVITVIHRKAELSTGIKYVYNNWKEYINMSFTADIISCLKEV